MPVGWIYSVREVLTFPRKLNIFLIFLPFVFSPEYLDWNIQFLIFARYTPDGINPPYGFGTLNVRHFAASLTASESLRLQD